MATGHEKALNLCARENATGCTSGVKKPTSEPHRTLTTLSIRKQIIHTIQKTEHAYKYILIS